MVRGENAGRLLTHVGVTRQLKQLGPIELGSAVAKDVSLSIRLASTGSRLVAFIQDPGSGYVLGVAVQKF